MASGIYQIVNSENGHRYIGSAACLADRRAVHRRSLRRGIHHSPHLQRAWTKYGESAFRFETLEKCSEGFLTTLEQVYLDWCRPEYNVCRIARSWRGMKHTEETKAKIRAANMGNRARLGMPHTPETIAKMSAIKMGNKHALGCKRSPETLRKLSEAAKGRRHSVESKNKMSRSQKIRFQRENGNAPLR